jgi:predicted ribosome quality control (RQC) complex YloA/Tae2 family protein
MHLSYFALRHVAAALHERLKNGTFIDAFSFSKQELVISFLTPEETEFFISIHFVNRSCYLQFNHNYNRPKRGFLYQFEGYNGGIVEEVLPVTYDRSFFIRLKTGYTLLFKLHGNFSNVIVINSAGDAEDIFRKGLTSDMELNLNKLRGEFDPELLVNTTLSTYEELRNNFPVLDATSLKYLNETDFLLQDSVNRTALVDRYFRRERVPFHLIEDGIKSGISIFPKEGAIVYDDPLEACTKLARMVLPAVQAETLKLELTRVIGEKLKRVNRQYLSLGRHLQNAQRFREYENTGHLIMANLHLIQPGMSSAGLADFHSGQTKVIRLDKKLNAQENAEKYYRRSKTLKKDVPGLEAGRIKCNEEKGRLEALLEQLETLAGFKALKEFAAGNKLQVGEAARVALPFHRGIIDGFDIWVGKNAVNNDLLTMEYANKNDLWFHAKDVAGSHVILRHRPGVIPTRATLEKAAAVAAYYSKSKSQGLASVQYALKKFVVKPRKANPGEVSLLSEQTLLVKPAPLETQ